MSPDTQIPRLLPIEEVAEIIGIPTKTLYAWRTRGEGPTAHKVGRHLRYHPSDVVAWIESRRESES